MSEPRHRYRFYPSILDKFQRYLRIDRDFESPSNVDPVTGYYKRSHGEMEAEAFRSLIDAINRVPFDSEAADRGTAFNEVIDCMIERRNPRGMKVERVYSVPVYNKTTGEVSDAELIALRATYNNRTFNFSTPFVREAARYFEGSISQYRVSATLETGYGSVELYGVIDELRGDRVYDIKTTSRYEVGKYAGYWQRHLYPYCLIESGDCGEVSSFEFTAFQLRGGTSHSPLITGTMYPEVYKYDHDVSREALRQHAERFIEFLEENREKITDKKIFGGESDE